MPVCWCKSISVLGARTWLSAKIDTCVRVRICVHIGVCAFVYVNVQERVNVVHVWLYVGVTILRVCVCLYCEFIYASVLVSQE